MRYKELSLGELVSFVSKGIPPKYTEIKTTITAILSAVLIFLDIPNQWRIVSGVVYVLFLSVTYVFLWMRANALTRPQAVKDVYENDDLIALTHELTDMLRKSRTIDWQKKQSARARMRMLVKRLLKKYKYPPEGEEEALETVISQCEMWVDNSNNYEYYSESETLMVAEE